jgi:glutamine phosphoribosylpyrophosphate amidotransferase
MCGIGGFYAPKGVHMDTELIKSLWHSLEDRGTHAAGLAYLWSDSDKVVTQKQVGPAHLMSKKAMKQMGTMVQYVLLHTRYTTHGSSNNEYNIHPIMRDGIIMTHNGVVRNKASLMHSMGAQTFYEVDTEAVVVGVATQGPAWTFNNIEGSASVAWVDEQTDKEAVHLFTNGKNPLVIGRMDNGTVVWASCDRHLEQLPIADWFHATPGKLYTITSDTVIRSAWLPGEWKQPMFQQNESWRVF